MRISVLIPTYKRPDLIGQAVASCLIQNPFPFEILIGDDSPDSATASVVASLKLPEGVSLRYFHNNPSLGQARNIHNLFRHAKGDLVTLLHDDDLFCPGAFQSLLRPLAEDASVVASFGSQKILDAKGREIPEQTQKLNETFYRLPQEAGRVEDPLVSSFLQQFPNNGWMLRNLSEFKDLFADVARWNDACDNAFGIEVGKIAKANNWKYYFVPAHTAAYRITPVSVGKGKPNRPEPIYHYLFSKNISNLDYSLPRVKEVFAKRAEGALARAWRIRRYFTALRIVFGPALGLSFIFSSYGAHVIYNILFRWSKEEAHA